MATAVAMTFEEALGRVRPEFASAATVYAPGSFARDAELTDAWARHAARANGFGAPEVAEADIRVGEETMFETACRIAASLVR